MLRLGLVDFDTSHSIEFTRRFNHVGIDRDQWVEGARVVVGCPGTSIMSPERIAGHAEQIAACGVKLVDDPADMIGEIDAVLIESICGAAHRERMETFLHAGIPVFIDKPFASSAEDAKAIVDLARINSISLMSSSALRFSDDILTFQSKNHGRIHGVISYGPAHRAEGNPGLLHYGIHAIEVVYALIGPGCEIVSALHQPEADVVTARWNDGRFAHIRGLRSGAKSYGLLIHSEAGMIPLPISARFAYRNLCREIVTFFETKRPAVPIDETLELITFCLSALNSEQQAGKWIDVRDAMK
ncbi:MAG: Gfo/Idh/MocA family oxidoreductase [Planctomycetota bacterium]|nr:Gfo/Idh/MocA family oxidoreductase [Planctomycetota bacterium]MDA1211291.1 Gfo/Idh/MocA family oxidoreductase [Planctomycetota bacterium]